MTRSQLLCGLGAVAILAGCYGSLQLAPNDAPVVLSRQLIEAPSPARAGTFAVKQLFYGHGTDLRRPEYRDSVAFKTRTVDMSKFVSMDPPLAKERKSYWGFDTKAFPINARVWYPEGAGPFPLVLIVHGNHNMKDFSDPGYGYLGELLASRGYILASVDMNFINGALRNENDGRGILLLEHLKAWKAFNEDAQNPFYRKVDFDKIALMGHSRGGEAVGHAAAFNRLPRYPDDANVKLDYGFPIKSIVAIAPVDGQYRPSEKLQPVENVNYLVFHGSHDGDVTVFHGLRQYQRVKFTDGQPHFKAAVYVYRANHGQWNSVWNNKDNGPRSARVLDLRGLLEPEEQREFGKVYISAFLDATLKGNKSYLPLFRDYRVAGQWLPKTMYVTRFEDNNYRSVAGFEEDVDVQSASVPGITLRGDSLATWKETLLTFRSAARAGGTSDPQNNYAVWLGWNNRIAGDDTTRTGPPATYGVQVTDSLASSWNIDGNTSFAFLLAATDARPGPRQPAQRDTTKKPDAKKKPAAPKPPKIEYDTTTILITLEAEDANGQKSRVSVNRYGLIRRPLPVKVLRVEGEDKKRFGTTYELVLQSFSIPLRDFAAQNASFDPKRLRAIRFVFEPTIAGTVVLDELGFSKLDPAFLVAGRVTSDK
ncbi:MAG: alpha/beta hydrolase family protein [Longimicrobiales bacterium]